MIVPSSGVKVLIAMKPVDFRKGMDGLAAVVHETLGANPFGGVIYVFRSKRADCRTPSNRRPERSWGSGEKDQYGSGSSRRWGPP